MSLPALVLRRAALAEILPLRHAELRPGRPLAAAVFAGDDDAAALHCGAFLAAGGAAVGCVSLMPRALESAPAWQLRGMATRADLVGRGIGTRLLRFALETLRAGHGPVPVWCNARIGAVPFYARAGWEVVSAEFDIPTVGPHRVMVCR